VIGPLVPPAAVNDVVFGDTLKSHAGGGGGGAAAWFTVNACPPIVTLPLRAAPVLLANAMLIVAVPVPELPLVTPIQPATAVTDHWQPAGLVMVNDAVPASAATDTLCGESA
jgi:hypothetical protein